MEKVLKIAVIGPESTGKSTLSAQLAEHYQCPWVEEYAREYCSRLTRPCTLEDEINMFHGQIALEEKALAQTPKLIICDTTILNVKVWCEYVLEECPEFVKETIRQRHYDLYLLMDIDMPWEYDPLREFPHLREHFLSIYTLELKLLSANSVKISGQGTNRLENAIQAVDRFLQTYHPSH